MCIRDRCSAGAAAAASVLALLLLQALLRRECETEEEHGYERLKVMMACPGCSARSVKRDGAGCEICMALEDPNNPATLCAADVDRMATAAAANEVALMEAAMYRYHPQTARVRQLVGRFIPDAAGRIRESTACLYTNLPDRDWVIDRHPDEPRVVIGSPCSGHGFKFASAIGEILADLATDRTPSFDITPFSLGHSA